MNKTTDYNEAHANFRAAQDKVSDYVRIHGRIGRTSAMYKALRDKVAKTRQIRDSIQKAKRDLQNG